MAYVIDSVYNYNNENIDHKTEDGQKDIKKQKKNQ